MAPKKTVFIVLILFFVNVESASLLERSYEYVMNLGKNLAPSFMTLLDCFGEEEAWSCAKEKAGKIFDAWDSDVEKQRRNWQDAADAEVASSGRSIEELPSQLGAEVEESLIAVADLVQNGVARALGRKKHDDSGGIDSITISTSANEKKKKKKQKQKPPKIHLIHPVMMPQNMEEKGRGFQKIQSWVIGDTRNAGNVEDENATSSRTGRGIVSDLWALGEKTLDDLAEHAIESENAENGVSDKSSFEEQRGKKKKKKKAILKLLILGAVLKAKIGTLLQILSFKLQLKFFLIALIGLGINFARFWLDLKKQHQQPQKVIYYEHAQHQHHYEHEEEPGWGPWSRSMDPQEDIEIDLDIENQPYRGHNSNSYSRPVPSRV